MSKSSGPLENLQNSFSILFERFSNFKKICRDKIPHLSLASYLLHLVQPSCSETPQTLLNTTPFENFKNSKKFLLRPFRRTPGRAKPGLITTPTWRQCSEPPLSSYLHEQSPSTPLTSRLEQWSEGRQPLDLAMPCLAAAVEPSRRTTSTALLSLT